MIKLINTILCREYALQKTSLLYAYGYNFDNFTINDNVIMGKGVDMNKTVNDLKE